MDIKILVAAHKPYWMPDDNVYLPIQVGATGKESLGWQRDDAGDNISAKNPNYCELTALYWAWKNLDAEYIGLCHYRRYFTRKEVHSVEGKRNQILTGEDWKTLLSQNPIIIPDKRKYYIETNESHYKHAHHSEGLDVTKQIIMAEYPEYLAAYEIVMQRTWAHMFNMFVMWKDLYDEYMQWMFSILLELERRLDITGWSVYEARVFGFVSELLLDVWLEKNQLPYAEQNVSFLERQNWLKKGGAFIYRKIRR